MSKITEKQYLDMRGFSSLDWTVLEKDNAVKLLEKQGAINNMYTIKESKAVASFGKGAYIVKKEWMKPFESEISDSKEESAPAVSGLNVPKAPPAVPKKETDVSKEEMSQFLKSRIANLEKFGWVNDPKNVSIYCNNDKDRGKTISYEELEEMDNKEWDKYILVPAKEIEVKDEETVVSFQCDKYDNTGEACDKQCNTCKAKDTVKDIAEKTGIPKDNLVVGSVPKRELENPIKLRIERLNKMGYELADDFYKKFYDNGKKWFGIKESYVLESDAVTFVEYLKNLEKQEAEIAEQTAEAIAETQEEMTDEEAEALGDETRKELVKSGEIKLPKPNTLEAESKEEADGTNSNWTGFKEVDEINPEDLETPAEKHIRIAKESRESKKVKKETKVSKPKSVKGSGKETPKGAVTKEPIMDVVASAAKEQKKQPAMQAHSFDNRADFFDKDNMLEQIDFVEKQAVIFTKHAELLHALYEINEVMFSDEKDSLKLEKIQDRLNTL